MHLCNQIDRRTGFVGSGAQVLADNDSLRLNLLFDRNAIGRIKWRGGEFEIGLGLPLPTIPTCDMEVGEIIAWRVWRIANCGFPGQQVLTSMVMNETVWKPGEAVHAPIRDPYCMASGGGVHAFKERGYAESFLNQCSLLITQDFAGFAIGKVALWGEVIEHETGYRAEYAKVREIVQILPTAHGLDRYSQHQLIALYNTPRKAQGHGHRPT